MRRLVQACSWFVLLGCAPGATPRPSRAAPGIVIPTTFGEGKNRESPAASAPPAAAATAESSAAESGQAPATAPSPAPQGGPPDPEPLRLSEQWEYELQMKAGTITVLGTERRRFKKPVVSARRFGRYAIELWIGRELVERIRFDFPSLALEEPPPSGPRRKLYAPPDLTRGADVRQKVLVPAAPRARRAVLVDRATGNVITLPWPPDQPIEPVDSASPAAAPEAKPAGPSPAP